jgi:Holliday junction resolvase
MKTPESYEKADICKYLDSIGAWYFKPYMAGFGKSGVPDIIGCWRGRFFSIEVKREGKKPTKIQEDRIAEVESVGGKAFWGTAAKVVPEFKWWASGVT